MQKILKQAIVQSQLKAAASKQTTQMMMLSNLFNFNMRAFNTKVFVEGLPLDWTDSQL